MGCPHISGSSPARLTARLQAAACLCCELATSQGHHPRISTSPTSAAARDAPASASDWLGGAPSILVAQMRPLHGGAGATIRRFFPRHGSIGVRRARTSTPRSAPRRTLAELATATRRPRCLGSSPRRREEQRPDCSSQMRSQTPGGGAVMACGQGARPHLPYRAGCGHARARIFCGQREHCYSAGAATAQRVMRHTRIRRWGQLRIRPLLRGRGRPVRA